MCSKSLQTTTSAVLVTNRSLPAPFFFRTFFEITLSKSTSITPYVSSGGGLLTSIALTGGNAIGWAAGGGLLGTFAMPFLVVAGVCTAAGWAVGQAVDALTEQTSQPVRPLIDVTPVQELEPVPVREVRTAWHPYEVYNTFSELY